MNKKIIITVVCVVVLVGAGFYWATVRPTRIRTKCDHDSKYAASYDSIWKNTGVNSGGFRTGEYVDVPKSIANGYSQPQYETYYKDCLRTHGL